MICTSTAVLVPTLTVRPLQLVGRVDDGALARVVDQRVLDVQGMGGDDALDEVLLAGAVQGQAEAAAEDLAALRDERLELVVDVVLAGEGGVADRREAARGKAVEGA